MDNDTKLIQETVRLKKTLTGNVTATTERDTSLINEARELARVFSQATGGIAVISDYTNNVCHIYSGIFGQTSFELPPYLFDNKSAFEDIIFQKVQKDDLLERHILELRFIQFLNNIPTEKKTEYQASCTMRMVKGNGENVYIYHTTRSFYSQPNGSALCGLCTYIPIPQVQYGAICGITNLSTGNTVSMEVYENCGRDLLSRRQAEVLSLLAKGLASKQIADKLCISQNTVNRHRQDILSALRVTNTTAAVETALRMRLI